MYKNGHHQKESVMIIPRWTQFPLELFSFLKQIHKKKLYKDTEPRKVSQLIFLVNKSFTEIVGDVGKMTKNGKKCLQAGETMVMFGDR